MIRSDTLRITQVKTYQEVSCDDIVNKSKELELMESHGDMEWGRFVTIFNNSLNDETEDLKSET